MPEWAIRLQRNFRCSQVIYGHVDDNKAARTSTVGGNFSERVALYDWNMIFKAVLAGFAILVTISVIAEKVHSPRPDEKITQLERPGAAARMLFASKAENLILDRGVDIQCSDDDAAEDGPALICYGPKVDRVFAHEFLKARKAYRKIGYTTVTLMDGRNGFGYNQRFDIAPEQDISSGAEKIQRP